MNICQISLNSRLLLNYVIQVNIDPDLTEHIRKIRIEHDGRLPGKGWRLDKACVTYISISFSLIFYYAATKGQSDIIIK